jgi:hypothetical protein
VNSNQITCALLASKAEVRLSLFSKLQRIIRCHAKSNLLLQHAIARTPRTISESVVTVTVSQCDSFFKTAAACGAVVICKFEMQRLTLKYVST